MIEINLLPPELQKKRNINKVTIPKEFIVTVVVALLAVLILFHGVLQLIIIVNKISYASLNKTWISIKPQKKQVDALKEQLKALEDSEKTFKQLSGQGAMAAQKLNLISDLLPNGIWLNELFLSEGMLEINGSCVSASGQEMVRVGKLLSAIKNNEEGMDYFPRVELISVFRNMISRVEIVDFLISSKDSKPVSKK